MSGDDRESLPEQVKASRIAAFAAHGPRYARLAEALLDGDTDAQVFALAHLVVDHEARLDALADRLRAAEARADQMAAQVDRDERIRR